MLVNGETAIKPYWYLRNGLLHIRYAVDRCIKLSKEEEDEIKKALAKSPADKQQIFSEFWNFYSNQAGKPVMFDGLGESRKKIKELADGYKN